MHGFGSAITIRNKEDETPGQLAQRMGYSQLSDYLDPLIQAQREAENHHCKCNDWLYTVLRPAQEFLFIWRRHHCR